MMRPNARANAHVMKVTFSDFFEVPPETVEQYGAFDISLLADLPLFVDPFLLFNSKKRAYQQLHEEMINYLRFLRSKSESQQLDPDLIDAWYRFPEIEQNWLGFSESGNSGHGLGKKFAGALIDRLIDVAKNANIPQLASSFGTAVTTAVLSVCRKDTEYSGQEYWSR